MRLLTFSIAFYALILSACAQNAPAPSQSNQVIGGRCEGCEATLQYGDRVLNWVDTLSEFHSDGPKVEVSGTVYQADGQTPAPGVILYLYHTNQEGRYAAERGATGWADRHGKLRTWLLTDEQGHYKFYTLRPASYPNSRIPAHIHIFLKEPGVNPYYIDDIFFDDDPYLTPGMRTNQEERGGNGILTGKQQGDITIYQRDIILGLNVPGYGE